jgi:Ca2+-binding RTX toxin-like protein
MELNFINGTISNDNLSGTVANEIFYGGPGNDRLEGAGGTDTARYSDISADFTVSTVNGVTLVKHREGKETTWDGNDKLTGIERLQFGDKTVLLTENGAPVATGYAVSIDEDHPYQISAAELVARHAIDPDGDPLALLSVGGAMHGTVAIGSDGIVTFTPDAGYNGPAEFAFTVRDSTGEPTRNLTATANVTLTVVENDATSHIFNLVSHGASGVATTVFNGDSSVPSAVGGPGNWESWVNPYFYAATVEHAGITEFDVGAGERDLQSATLTGWLWPDYWNLPAAVEVFAYAADGQVAHADGETAGDPVVARATLDYSDAGDYAFILDPEPIEAILATSDWLGLAIRIAEPTRSDGGEHAITFEPGSMNLELVW